NAHAKVVRAREEVSSVRFYQQHEVDISGGQHPPLPLKYLGLYELCLDGAERARDVIRFVTGIHLEQPAACAPATWLYYPVSEKVGRPSDMERPMLTLAFANALPGRELEFREFYATRHIRHALNIPALVSGQC